MSATRAASNGLAPVAWSVVAVAAWTGRPRIAAVAAWCGAAIEAARAGVLYADLFSVFSLWQVAMAVMGAAALSVATPRPAAGLLGRGRLTLLLLFVVIISTVVAPARASHSGARSSSTAAIRSLTPST